MSPNDIRTIEQVAADEAWQRLGLLEQERRRCAYWTDRGLDDPLAIASARDFTTTIYRGQ